MDLPATSSSMTAEAFVAWAMAQERGRYELEDGEILVMAPERTGHALGKLEIAIRLREAVRRAGIDAQVFPDGVAVRIGPRTVYEPDCQLRLGPPLPRDTVLVHDPLVVIEVISPSTAARDKRVKLANYFLVPSIRHYVIVQDGRPTVLHTCGEDGAVRASTHADGRIRLDPPGLDLDLGGDLHA